ncbi:RDD family protein [Streptomyces triticagri]|uniref:RDD family protein n=1 Tax=Streptomyces triticagri TaxID=2293568 RepID=A0A372LWJ9_9ACTN|nr:RDD family protein [Streptomyces triticagri]RFU82387.1 RDD family protein [Streptomyces triticagri]
MSAPTPAPGDSSPKAGFYPDPSIPGYVRYWNGVAWVPGTSRPAPSEGEAMPTPPAAAAGPPPAHGGPVDETGPVFFDEEPQDEAELHGSRPEPASAWQADTNRQAGFGSDDERRVSWGGSGRTPRGAGPGGTPGTPDPRAGSAPSGGAASTAPSSTTPASATPSDANAAPGSGRDEGARADGTMAIRSLSADTAARVPEQKPGEDTMMVRRMQPGDAKARERRAAEEDPAAPSPAPATEGTMTIRALPGSAADSGRTAGSSAESSAAAAPAPAPPAPAAPAPASPGAPPAYGYPQGAPAAQAGSPLTPGSGGGSASWAQQVHQLAQTPQAQAGESQPVTPWKPPVNDPFLAAAQAAASGRPAGLGRRFLARLVDTVVLAAVTGAAALPFVTKASDHIDDKIQTAKMSGETVTVWLIDGTTSVYLGIVLGVLLVFGVLYEAVPTAKWGRTLGKKLFGLQVRDIEAHESPSFGAALRRWLVYAVPGVLVVGVVGVVWCVFDRPWRQCLHDKAARTFVLGPDRG